jgi:hypothetical protein
MVDGFVTVAHMITIAILATLQARAEFSEPLTWLGPGLLARVLYVIGGGLGFAAWMSQQEVPIASRVMVSLIGMAIAWVGKVVSRRRQLYGQRVREAAAAKTAASVIAGQNARYSLYLRSFSATGALPQLRTAEGEHGRGEATVDFETMLAAVVQESAPLITFGARGEHVGAGRLERPEESWRSEFEKLALAAETIFVLPGISQSVLWEVEWLRTHRLFGKCIFLMPPQLKRRSDAEREWLTTSRKLLAADGVILPPFSDNGALFTILEDRTPGVVIDLNSPLKAIKLAESLEILRRGGPEPTFKCPHCEAPYRLSQYRPDALVKLCSDCDRPLPASSERTEERRARVASEGNSRG